jgi:hypothetical protein
MEDNLNFTLYLLFTDDPHDPHMQGISLGQFIEYHNTSDFSRLGGHNFIIFTDKELCRSVLQHFGGAE